MRAPLAGVIAAAWLGTAGAAMWVVSAHDATVAVGAEVWPGLAATAPGALCQVAARLSHPPSVCLELRGRPVRPQRLLSKVSAGRPPPRGGGGGIHPLPENPVLLHEPLGIFEK